MTDEEPAVYYVPGAENHYRYDTNVIVLDEHLKEYPLAHEYILEHEREHANRRTFLGYVEHELAADIDYYFGSGPVHEEIHEYMAAKRERKSPIAGFSVSVGMLFRHWWNIVFKVVAWVLGVMGDD